MTREEAVNGLAQDMHCILRRHLDAKRAGYGFHPLFARFYWKALLNWPILLPGDDSTFRLVQSEVGRRLNSWRKYSPKKATSEPSQDIDSQIAEHEGWSAPLPLPAVSFH